MSLSLIVVAAGIAVLLGLAVVVGLLNGGAQRAAWNRIAVQRRSLGERERALRRQQLDLLEWEAALADESGRRRA